MADWNKIKAEYVKGGTSYRKLAEKYNVPFGTLRRRATSEKWTQIRTQAEKKSNTKIINAEADRRTERYKRMVDVTDKLLDLVEKAINETNTGERVIDKSVLKQLSGTLKDIKDIQNIKPKLDIEEQEAKIALLRKQAESDIDKTPNAIKVTIAGGDDSWQT